MAESKVASVKLAERRALVPHSPPPTSTSGLVCSATVPPLRRVSTVLEKIRRRLQREGTKTGRKKEKRKRKRPHLTPAQWPAGRELPGCATGTDRMGNAGVVMDVRCERRKLDRERSDATRGNAVSSPNSLRSAALRLRVPNSENCSCALQSVLTPSASVQAAHPSLCSWRSPESCIQGPFLQKRSRRKSKKTQNRTKTVARLLYYFFI